MKKRYKLIISYDGTHYVGWQWQKNGLSVQQVLEEAFLKITGEKDKRASIRPMGAGRTDSGVHAIGQVAHADLSWEHPPEDLQRALNSILPEDVIISSVESIDKTFDAQKDARQKWYRYIVYNGRSAPLFERGKAWSVVPLLDLEAVRKAASVLEGEHDFASFQGAGAMVKTTVRCLNKIEINKIEHSHWPWLRRVAQGIPLADRAFRPAPDKGMPRRQDPAHNAETAGPAATWILFDFYGEGFLKQMVRNITGTLIEVGLGKRSEKEFVEILEARDRKKAGCSAPPYGLYLMKVFYD